MNDPKLEAATKEIEAIYHKYDLGGGFALSNGLGTCSFQVFFRDPSWSTISFPKPGQFKIDINMKTEPERTNRTIDMLVNLKHVFGTMLGGTAAILEVVEQKVKIESVIMTPENASIN